MSQKHTNTGRRDFTMLDQSMSEQQTNVGKIINSKSINLLLAKSPALGNTVASRSKTNSQAKRRPVKSDFPTVFYFHLLQAWVIILPLSGIQDYDK